MPRKRNPITEAFSRLEDDPEAFDPSTDELEGEEDADAEEFVSDSDAGEYTDEDVIEEVEQFDQARREAVENSRQRGRSATRAPRGQRPARQTAAKAAVRARTPQRERDFEWKPANTLESPPPRPGMEQRWVRFQLGDKNDPRNWSRKMRERWAPRKLDTVPEQFMPPTLTHGQLGDVIGVGDLILCERPAQIGASRRKYFRQKQSRQVAAAQKRHVNKVQRDDHPITVTERRERPTVGVGRRRAQVQDDE
jgi:hypothetical protein